MKKVQILLSTYNGSQYVEEQINSILNQDYPEISLLIRDDGSKDDTLQIIKRLAAEDCRISYYQGDNLGVYKSFFDLMIKADLSADYYALSDQDDLWKSDKIRKAVEMLGDNKEIPILYCSNTSLVDEDLKPLENKIKRPRIRPSFGNALVENISAGCTCVFNKKLLEIVVEHLPDFTIMHDWWLYLTASAFGKTIYDENAYILYRQHSNNVVGSRFTYFDEFKVRVNNFNNNRGKINHQLREFKRLYVLDNEKAKLLNMVILVKKITYRIRIIFNTQIYRQRKMDNFIFKILYLTGKI